MFDIGASELLLIVIVAIVVIGPKDMPLALRTAGRWIGKVRRVSGHFRSGIETMIREAEMEEMEKKWKEQNAKIMADHPAEGLTADSTAPVAAKAGADTPKDEMEGPPAASAEARSDAAKEQARPAATPSSEPQLPLGNPKPPA